MDVFALVVRVWIASYLAMTIVAQPMSITIAL